MIILEVRLVFKQLNLSFPGFQKVLCTLDLACLSSQNAWCLSWELPWETRGFPLEILVVIFVYPHSFSDDSELSSFSSESVWQLRWLIPQTLVLRSNSLPSHTNELVIGIFFHRELHMVSCQLLLGSCCCMRIQPVVGTCSTHIWIP